MKKLFIFIVLVLVAFKADAQPPFPVDTSASWRYLFVGDSINFINTEYIVRTDLIKQGGRMKIWAFPLVDTITHTVYACETPSPDRFIKMTELSPIKDDILAFARGLITLQQLKIITYGSTIPKEYKQLIFSMMLVNTRLYRTNNNFCCFKK